MLKAVRFDEAQHKHLLDFIEFYQDDKGKRNDSEAIRYLMQKGFEVVTNQTFSKPIEIPQSNNIDMSALKKELLNEISVMIKPKEEKTPNIEEIKNQLKNELLSQMNNDTLNGITALLDKISNMQPMVIQQTSETAQFTEVNTTKPSAKPKPIDIPADADGLLGNLLANANR